MEGRNG
jgi:hypothetical protein